MESVRIPVDRDTKRPKPFAFIKFYHEESVPYSIELLQDVRLFGRNLRMQNKATGAGMQPTQPEEQPRTAYYWWRASSAAHLPASRQACLQGAGFGSAQPTRQEASLWTPGSQCRPSPLARRPKWSS